MQFKKNKMKIAFCGDSFCMDATKNLYPTYPYLVGKEFNAEVLGLGMSGCALFHSYELMMENNLYLGFQNFSMSDRKIKKNFIAGQLALLTTQLRSAEPDPEK